MLPQPDGHKHFVSLQLNATAPALNAHDFLYLTRLCQRIFINHSSIVFTHSHPPLNFSFHKLTLLSPPLTANTFPAMLQLTLHTTTSKSNVSHFHAPASPISPLAGSVQILTV